MSETNAALSCPRCKLALGALEVRNIALQGCGNCKGVLVGQSDLPRLLAATSADLLKSFDPETTIEPVKKDAGAGAACPRCAAAMENDDYCAAGLVHFDRCARCNVLWLDADELGAMTLMWARMDTLIARERAHNQQLYQQLDDIADRIKLGRAVGNILFRILR
jgi:Zn-finger nucleic acid-binding protein